MAVECFGLHPEATEFISKAEVGNRHSGERNGHSLEGGEVNHCLGKDIL